MRTSRRKQKSIAQSKDGKFVPKIHKDERKDNRDQRRREAYDKKHTLSRDRKWKASIHKEELRRARAKKVEKRVARAQLRKTERLAKIPYSGEKNKKPFVSKRSLKLKK